MNKIKLFLLAAIVTLTAGSVSAQKSGYISIDQVVGLMPEIGKIDTVLQKFQADSLQPQLAVIVQEYNYKDSILNSKDSLKTPATVRKQYRQDLQNISYQVQNWQGFMQQAMQSKQEQLLEPVYRKAMNALNAVAKENGYSYVYNREVLLVAPPADDLFPLVAKKLGIKVPTGSAPAAAAPKK
jgi:outer membrane protein